MKRFLIASSKVIEKIIFIIGIFSLFIILHEAYHLHLGGEAVGLCIGKCDIYGEVGFAGVYLENFKQPVPITEETDASFFAFAGTILISLLYLVGFLLSKNE
jgi:hypothetical protein